MKNDKLNLITILALIVGSILGAGIFSMPQNFAETVNGQNLLLVWIIAGIGVGSIAWCFIYLSRKRPEVSDGIYTYAESLMGPYMGFNSVWGYWLSAVAGNVYYIVVFFSNLGLVIPFFGVEKSIWILLIQIILIIFFHILVSSGLKISTLTNSILTTIKVLGILIILFTLLLLGANLWKENLHFPILNDKGDLISSWHQIKSAIVIILFSFIGIEGAIVMAKRAKTEKIIGIATILGLLICFLIMFSISILSYNVFFVNDLQSMPNPSTVTIMAYLLGPIGKYFIFSIFFISVFGALIVWTLFATEVLYSGAERHVFPSTFAKLNKKGIPSNALLISNISVFIILILSYFSQEAYDFTLEMTVILILYPYLFSALYAFIFSLRQWKWAFLDLLRLCMFLFAIVFIIFVIISNGWIYILLSAVAYFPGLLIYMWSAKEKNLKSFHNVFEIALAILIGLIALITIVLLLLGQLTL